jgi:hypothetical protein
VEPDGPFATLRRREPLLLRLDVRAVRRPQLDDLGGGVALVTGARVKIGYQAAIRIDAAAARAHADLEGRRTTGPIVLTVWTPSSFKKAT